MVTRVSSIFRDLLKLYKPLWCLSATGSESLRMPPGVPYKVTALLVRCRCYKTLNALWFYLINSISVMYPNDQLYINKPHSMWVLYHKGNSIGKERRNSHVHKLIVVQLFFNGDLHHFPVLLSPIIWNYPIHTRAYTHTQHTNTHTINKLTFIIL